MGNFFPDSCIFLSSMYLYEEHHQTCKSFILEKDERINLSKKIHTEISNVSARRIKRIKFSLFGALGRKKTCPISSLNIPDIIEEVNLDQSGIGRNDEVFINDVLEFCKSKTQTHQHISDIIPMVGKILVESSKMLIFINSHLTPNDYSPSHKLVEDLFTITTNRNDAEHLADAFEWSFIHSNNKHFVTHDRKDILNNCPKLLGIMLTYNRACTLELVPIRVVKNL